MNEVTGLRPRSVGEILDASFALYRRRFGSLLLATTVLSIPALVFAALIAGPSGEAFQQYMGSASDYFRQTIHDGGRPTRAQQEAMEAVLANSKDVWIFGAISALLQAMSRGAATAVGAVAAWCALGRTPFPSAWRLVRSSLPLLGASTAVHLVLAIGWLLSGACCVTLPFVIVVAVILAPASAVMWVERRQLAAPPGLRWILAGGSAVSRCIELSLHGRTIARGTWCIAVSVTFVSAVVGVATAAAYVASSSFAVLSVINHFAEVVFLPVPGIAFALWYADLRVRREGLDFERREAA